MEHTRQLCLMNLAINGLEGDLGRSYGSTFTNDQHKTLRADYILANPPFNISDWDGDKLAEDPRWTFGIPPASNANYAWLQHMWNRLSNKGRAGIVLSNGSMSTNTSNEGIIRKNMVEGDAIECMVALPAQLFSNTQIPACLWFLSKNKKAGANGSIDRSGQVLFIDARYSATGRISRTQIEFTQSNLEEISMLYHRWRGTEFSDDGVYEDIPGLVYSASLTDIGKHDFVLTPGRYVGAGKQEVDEEPFVKKMARLNEKLQMQFLDSKQMETEINKALGEIGYGI